MKTPGSGQSSMFMQFGPKKSPSSSKDQIKDVGRAWRLVVLGPCCIGNSVRAEFSQVYTDPNLWPPQVVRSRCLWPWDREATILLKKSMDAL